MLSNHALTSQYRVIGPESSSWSGRLMQVEPLTGGEAQLMLVLDLPDSGLETYQLDYLKRLQSFADSKDSFLTPLQISLEDQQLIAITQLPDQAVLSEQSRLTVGQGEQLLNRLLIQLSTAQKQELNPSCFQPESLYVTSQEIRCNALAAVARMMESAPEKDTSQIARSVIQAITGLRVSTDNLESFWQAEINLENPQLRQLLDDLLSSRITWADAALTQLRNHRPSAQIPVQPASKANSSQLSSPELQASNPKPAVTSNSASDTQGSVTRPTLIDLGPSKNEKELWDVIRVFHAKAIHFPPASISTNAISYSLSESEQSAITARNIVLIASFLLSILCIFIPFGIWIAPALLVGGSLYSPQPLSSTSKILTIEIRQTEAILSSQRSNLIKIITSKSIHDTFFRKAEDLWSRLNLIQKSYQLELNAQIKKELDYHKDQYLKNFIISDSNIPGVGSTRSAALATHGVKTAFDISQDRISSISGFGPGLVSTLVNWRQSLMERYQAPLQQDIIALKQASLIQKYEPQKNSLSVSFTQVSTDLKKAYKQWEDEYKKAKNEYDEISRKTAKAKQHLKLIQSPITSFLQRSAPNLGF